jgi:hypothetical protein
MGIIALPGQFVRDKDPAVSLVATWAVEGIDLRAAKRAGIGLPR